ncbi:MAG: zinc ribbon domain-containing protein [Myxococcales bacterium]|nr:zinc ribbon domain-containing protein [Myxococcales bacterium]MDH5307685.1 zinc ribbon domain-containing protein [Myxococcales bacterium]MDH5567615.1 zinc ribbon domain-containing protein [Myxococcales bacterium]
MPIYEYACDKCQSEFEVEQRINDAPVKTCPKCRSRKVKRLISQTSFVLKGGGWYSDLYASRGKKGKSEGAAESPSAAGKPEKQDAGATSDTGKEKAKEKGKTKGTPKAAA